MLYSDLSQGCKELGFIPRKHPLDSDREDADYIRFLKGKGITARMNYRESKVIVEEPASTKVELSIQALRLALDEAMGAIENIDTALIQDAPIKELHRIADVGDVQSGIQAARRAMGRLIDRLID